MTQTIKIKNAKIILPSIYEKQNYGPCEPRYKTVFKCDGNELREAGLSGRGKDDLYISSSAHPSEIISGEDYSALLAAYELCKARNISPDRMFKNQIVDLELRIYDYRHRHGRRGTGCAIQKIWVHDERELVRQAMSERD